MSKLISLCIAILILFQSFNIHADIIKLTEIIEHAQLHHKRYGDGLLTFLSKHYGSLKESHKKQHQQEEKEHPHPPIQHDCGAQTNFSHALLSHSFALENLERKLEDKANFYYQDKFSTFEKQRVFQPPQIV